MSTMNITNTVKFNFKRPELLLPKSPDVATKEEVFVLKLERVPVKVRNPSYTPDKLVALLNKLEHRGEIIKEVVMDDWTLSCRMADDIEGIIAKGNDRVNLSHYIWYGRSDCWQEALVLEDLVAELHRRHGSAVRPTYLSEKCLQLELSVNIVMLDR